MRLCTFSPICLLKGRERTQQNLLQFAARRVLAKFFHFKFVTNERRITSAVQLFQMYDALQQKKQICCKKCPVEAAAANKQI